VRPGDYYLPPHTLTRLARRLANLQSKDSALRLLRRAQHQYPDDFWLNLELGYALVHVEPLRWAEAARYLTAAVALRPSSPGVHLNLGLALTNGGQLDDAIACWKKAIDLDPRYAQAHHNLGNAMKAKGKVDEAIACYKKAVELDPKYAPAHDHLGYALAAAGTQKEAIEAWRTAVRLEPGLDMTHYWLGKALLLQGRPSEALVPLGEAAERLPAEHVRALGLPAERSRAERLSRLEKRLPDLLAGKDRLGDNRERLDLIDLCQRQHRFAAAARFFTEVFAGEAKLASIKPRSSPPSSSGSPWTRIPWSSWT
jgi:tetratricopeptide (TPR) repeat protein